MQEYQKKLKVEIEVWVTPRNEAFGGVPPLATDNYKDWKASVRHSNGVMEWRWCDTFEEAVEWCEAFAKPAVS
jgi:hypothetical protein